MITDVPASHEGLTFVRRELVSLRRQSNPLLSAAAARWQTRLARARNSHEEQEAHRAMNAYARFKGWEAKWADWKSDWLSIRNYQCTRSEVSASA